MREKLKIEALKSSWKTFEFVGREVRKHSKKRRGKRPRELSRILFENKPSYWKTEDSLTHKVKEGMFAVATDSKIEMKCSTYSYISKYV